MTSVDIHDGVSKVSDLTAQTGLLYCRLCPALEARPLLATSYCSEDESSIILLLL